MDINRTIMFPGVCVQGFEPLHFQFDSTLANFREGYIQATGMQGRKPVANSWARKMQGTCYGCQRSRAKGEDVPLPNNSRKLFLVHKPARGLHGIHSVGVDIE